MKAADLSRAQELFCAFCRIFLFKQLCILYDDFFFFFFGHKLTLPAAQHLSHSHC